MRAVSAKTLGVLSVVGLVVAFSLRSTLVKRAESPGVFVADPAREAFVHAMSRASALAALVAALGAVIAWRHLPDRGGHQVEGLPEPDVDATPAHETRPRRVARARA